MTTYRTPAPVPAPEETIEERIAAEVVAMTSFHRDDAEDPDWHFDNAVEKYVKARLFAHTQGYSRLRLMVQWFFNIQPGETIFSTEQIWRKSREYVSATLSAERVLQLMKDNRK